MKALLSAADRFIEGCSWKDLALVKACLLAMGVMIGSAISARRKKQVLWGAMVLFVATYVPLIVRFLPCLQEEAEAKKEL